MTTHIAKYVLINPGTRAQDTIELAGLIDAAGVTVGELVVVLVHAGILPLRLAGNSLLGVDLAELEEADE